MNVDINCQEVDERSNVFYRRQVCIASIKTSEGTCTTDLLKAGHFSQVNYLTFWARGNQGGEIVTFGIGGADALPIPGSPFWATLTNTWQRYEIDLEGLDLTNASVLFYWLAKDIDNPQGAVFYLDDIQFEGERIQTAATQSPRLLQNTEQHLDNLFTRLCWVAYSPTHFDPTTTPIQCPSEDDVREDLRVLRSAGFNGLVTYGSNYADPDRPDQILDIPGLAQEAGFEGMIVGVWNPANEDELQAAEEAGHYPVVVGYSVGNEGLRVRYDLETLVSAIERLRQTTGKPVSTTEEVNDYHEDSPLWTLSDWIFPNVHPYFAGRRDPREAVEWTERIFESLDSVSDKPLIFKEVGLPSDGDQELSESRQARYYQLLRETSVTYVVFEAFDAPWKHLGSPGPDGTYWPDPEPHWGIFASDRTPKEAAANICPVR
jgi:exo-beta-1,3-glucanase (GH17 family)